MIIIGGGEFANLIRKYDGITRFSNHITHETAIDSMDIIAKLLNDKFDFTKLVYSIEDAENSLNDGFIPILACSKILKENEDNNEIPHSWDMTSDSISAYIANLLKAKLLIATNVDGIYTQKPTKFGAKFIHDIDAKKLLTFDETSVDLMLAEYLLKFGTNCFVVNGNFPERVLSLIGEDIGSRINNNDYNTDYNFKYTLIRGE
ncbi:delta 1-pyrroline-5-carboxylate synthetase [Methanobrevibacter sp. TMH8]|nr:delta 1-pyrroline-5-carboxylate synthetase [Methanobrevibacter sp. TMH8]MBZ9570785.1 delta 1-pyrroline-5-carboxylate synthetase [Methanobrevibacter sp. TMH8]